MAQYLRFFCLLLGAGISLVPSLEASPWFWPLQSRSSSSIVTISIGNRINVETGLNDEGIKISNLTFNLSHRKGNLTFRGNGTEISITRGNDGVTNIHIDFDSSKPNTATSSNATQLNSRRKRAIFGLPSLPSIPIPTLNRTQAFLNGNFLPLPKAISNQTTNISTLLQPWQFLQSFINRRLPILTLDTVVSFLSQLYSSTAKQIMDTGINTLGETMDSFSSIVNSGLDYIEEQADSGIRETSQAFKRLTQAGQSCVGQVPDDATRPVVTKATGCVRDRWNELDDTVNQFLITVNYTEEAYGGWLRSLGDCNARNFAGLNDTELDTVQRSCYVQTIANSVGKIVDIPVHWATLIVKVSNLMTNFQPQVALCAAGVAAEVASVSANIGVRVVLCQIMQ